MSEKRKSADLLIVGIDWLITVDETRRIIRYAGIAVVALDVVGAQCGESAAG